jgi:hypothetical protein
MVIIDRRLPDSTAERVGAEALLYSVEIPAGVFKK